MPQKVSDLPGPTDYDIETGFQEAYKQKGLSTACFKTPVPKKIQPVNLYDPHKPASPKVKVPGPGYYKVEEKGTIKDRVKIDEKYLNSLKLSSVFIEENTDRFGKQIYPTKNFVVEPGPSDYNADKLVTKRNPIGVTMTTSKREGFTEKNRRELAKVGPGAYNSNIEPKKISFFLNQGDKWVA